MGLFSLSDGFFQTLMQAVSSGVVPVSPEKKPSDISDHRAVTELLVSVLVVLSADAAWPRHVGGVWLSSISFSFCTLACFF